MICTNCGKELYFNFHAGDYGEKWLCRRCSRIHIVKDGCVLALKCKVCGEKVTAAEPVSIDNASDIDWLCVKPDCRRSLQNYKEIPEWVEITIDKENSHA